MRAALGTTLKVRDSFGEPKSGPTSGLIPERGAGFRKSRRRTRCGGATPHDILWDAVRAIIEDAVREFENAVPGRKYRLDIALPAKRLAIEVDGWEWHGKHKGDFIRDRERQNLLTLHGWRILRFTAGQIRKDVTGCVELVVRAATNEGIDKLGSAGATHKSA